MQEVYNSLQVKLLVLVIALLSVGVISVVLAIHKYCKEAYVFKHKYVPIPTYAQFKIDVISQ